MSKCCKFYENRSGNKVVGTNGLKPYSQETAQNFEKLVLQKCIRIAFYTFIPVNLYNF